MHGKSVPVHPDQHIEEHRVGALIGWTHRPLTHGISLCLQSAQSQVALESNRVTHCEIAMTANQALLLARYLLDATGQDASALRGPARGGSTLFALFGRS